MKVISEPLVSYLEEARIEDLQREWEAKGYQVSREATIGGFRADLVAKRNGETVVFEVKTAKSLAQYRDVVSQLARVAAEQPNTTFHLVVANPPKQKTIEIENLPDILLHHLKDKLPGELDGLAPDPFPESLPSVDSVEDVEISDIRIHSQEIQVLGDGIVRVSWLYCTNGVIGLEGKGNLLVAVDTFPFEFDVLLDPSLALQAVNRLVVDTSVS
jgi:hypothetical protein